MHVGSNYAIAPAEYRIPESDIIYKANKWQQKLYEKWCEFADSLSPVDLLILLGDLTEGPQTKEKFGTLWLQNVQQQADTAIYLIKMWKWKKLIVIRGTDYHTAVPGVHVEEYIAKLLKAEHEHEKYSFHDRGIEVENISMHLAHGIGISSVPHYKATPLMREMWLMHVNADYFGRYDIIVRGHTHYIVSIDTPEGAIFTCPCWQYPTPYQRKKTSFGARAHFGLIEMEVDGKNYDITRHLIEVEKPERMKFLSEEIKDDGAEESF